jgi:hypothetical protein
MGLFLVFSLKMKELSHNTSNFFFDIGNKQKNSKAIPKSSLIKLIWVGG